MPETQGLVIRTTSSDMTNKLNSFARSAMPSISFLVNTLPMGLCGVLSTIIFVLGEIARLGLAQSQAHGRQRETHRNSSKSIFQSRPVGLSTPSVWGWRGT